MKLSTTPVLYRRGVGRLKQWPDEQPPAYPPIRAGDYLVQRVAGRRWELACGVADCVQAWREESVLAAARMEAFGRVEGSLP